MEVKQIALVAKNYALLANAVNYCNELKSGVNLLDVAGIYHDAQTAIEFFNKETSEELRDELDISRFGTNLDTLLERKFLLDK